MIEYCAYLSLDNHLRAVFSETCKVLWCVTWLSHLAPTEKKSGKKWGEGPNWCGEWKVECATCLRDRTKTTTTAKHF